MTDRTKGCVSMLFFVCAIVLPLFSLIAGWIGWGFEMGALAALVTFVLFFILGGVFAALSVDLSLLAISLPFIVGMLYTVTEIIALPFDDLAVACAGAILSSALFLRRYESAPRWVVIPMIVSALYTLVGEYVPGPVDDLLMGILGLFTTAIVAKRKGLEGPSAKHLPSPGTYANGMAQTKSAPQQ